MNKKKNSGKIFSESIGRQRKVYHTYIAGTNYNNPDGSSRETLIWRLGKGDEIHIVRESSNSYDRYAVVIKNTSGKVLGYIPHFIAVFLSRQLDDGHTAKASVEEVKATENGLTDCKITVKVD